MKSFFKSLNFARVVILLCIIATFPLGYFGWKQYQENEALAEALAPEGRVETLVGSIQSLSKQYSQLTRDRDADGLSGQANPESYIRAVAWRDKIEMGDVQIIPTPRPIGNDIVDRVYRITPSKKDASFQRGKIANFLYTLEADSPRVRVTQLSLETVDRRPAPEAVPTDDWKFDASVTSRERVERD